MHVWRSDVVGSLLRPAWLQEARGQVERGTLPAAEFKRIEDRAVDEAVALQEAAGLEVITDGEMRRYAFFGHLIEALEGFDKRGRLVGHLPRRRGPRGAAAAAGRRRQAGLAPADERRGVHLPARPHDAAGQGDAAQRAAGRGLLRSGALEGRVCHPRRLPRRSRGLHPPRDRGAGPARLRVHPDRRAAVRGAPRRDHPRGLPPARQRSRPAARHLHRAGQRDHRRASRRDVRDPHLPRQPQEHVLRLRRLRPDRRAHLPAGPLPALPARVRRRAIGDVRAAAPRAGRSRRGPRARQLEAGAAGIGAPSSSGGSPRRRATSRWSGSRSARSAASRRRTKATA